MRVAAIVDRVWPRFQGLRTIELGTPGAFREELNSLVLAGVNRATIAQADDYVRAGEEPDFVGERLAVLDDTGAAVAIVQTTRVDVLTLGQVRGSIGDELAVASGEGHRDADHLREAYRSYWARVGTPADDDTVIYAVWFESTA